MSGVELSGVEMSGVEISGVEISGVEMSNPHVLHTSSLKLFSDNTHVFNTLSTIIVR